MPRSLRAPGSPFTRRVAAVAAPLLFAALVLANGPVGARASTSAGVAPRPYGELDCNGFSRIQRSIKPTMVCTDPKGEYNGRFNDNGHYVGHDEPSVRFISKQHGSGNHVIWNEVLGRDPSHRPTVTNPGRDVTHYFELSIAPWFSMALCNPKSYPLRPCHPESDANAPDGSFPGGGSSFLEMQFYPPGFAPFVDNISCDNTHWCASLHINDLECTNGFERCNPNCIEPTNFAFIQDNGVPTGPPSPQRATLATFTPNRHTLLMNPGDHIVAEIFDRALPGGGHALETRIRDLTTGRSGYMIASARNGFMATSIRDCSGTPFNYRPEYDTAAPRNVVPWAALMANINTQFEIGHFTPCSSVSGPATFDFGAFHDRYWKDCHGAYERTTNGARTFPEGNDSPCFKRGDTHHGFAPPNEVTGCANFFAANGDLDFDGTSYWRDWPNDMRPGPFPSPFLQQQPRTRTGARYPEIQIETDLLASEKTCHPLGFGCHVPPYQAPGHFYPYWTLGHVRGRCVWEFGQMGNGNSFGGDAQYGGPSAWYFGTASGAVLPNPTSC